MAVYPTHICMYDIPVCVVSRFHFTTGKFPFEGENVYKLFAAISSGQFEMPPDLPPLLQDLLTGQSDMYYK